MISFVNIRFVATVVATFLVSTHAQQCNLCQGCGDFLSSAPYPRTGDTCGGVTTELGFDNLDPFGADCEALAGTYCPTPCCSEAIISEDCVPSIVLYQLCFFANGAECAPACGDADGDAQCDAMDIARICDNQAICCPSCYEHYKETIQCISESGGCAFDCDTPGTVSGPTPPPTPLPTVQLFPPTPQPTQVLTPLPTNQPTTPEPTLSPPTNVPDIEQVDQAPTSCAVALREHLKLFSAAAALFVLYHVISY